MTKSCSQFIMKNFSCHLLTIFLIWSLQPLPPLISLAFKVRLEIFSAHCWYHEIQKNWLTRLNHSIGSSPKYREKSSFAILDEKFCRPLSCSSGFGRDEPLRSWAIWITAPLDAIIFSINLLSVSSKWCSLSFILSSIRFMPSCKLPSPASKSSILSLLVAMDNVALISIDRSQ